MDTHAAFFLEVKAHCPTAEITRESHERTADRSSAETEATGDITALRARRIV